MLPRWRCGGGGVPKRQHGYPRFRQRKSNALDCVKAVLAKLLLKGHKVALDERDLVRQALLLGVLAGAEDLEHVVVDADDCAREGASQRLHERENSSKRENALSQSVKLAISRAGPPTPQPTSRTRMPGLMPVWEAR